jgi:hypothetical protein
MVLNDCPAFFAKSGLFAAINTVTNSRGSITRRTNKHYLRNGEGPHNLNYFSFFALPPRPDMLFINIDTLNDHPIIFAINFNNLPDLASIFAGYNFNIVTFFYFH